MSTTFPAIALPTVTELLIAGAYTDIADQVKAKDSITINRGRANESSRVLTSRMSLTLINDDGRFSNRKPTSAYYGQIGRNTRIRHRLRWYRDTFTRTQSDTWGSDWTNVGGSSTDYDVNGTAATHTLTSANVVRASAATVPVSTPDATAIVSTSATATGASLKIWVAVGSDDSNYYAAQLAFKTDGTAELSTYSQIGGGEATNGPVSVGAYTPNQQWCVRVQLFCHIVLRVRAWPASQAEPDAWAIANGAVVGATPLTTFTQVRLRSRRETGNTNTNPVVSWHNVEVVDDRFCGVVPAWPQAWDIAGVDVTAPIEAAGVMRQLGSGGSKVKVLKSPMTRGIPGDSPLEWWPLEDNRNSGLTGGLPMRQIGQVNFAANGDHPGSAPLPDYSGGGSLVANLRNGSSTSSWRAEFTARFGTGANSVDDFTAAVDIRSPLGDVNRWQFFVTDAATAIGAKGFALQWSDTSGGFTGTLQTDALVDDGAWHHFRADVAQSGGNIAVSLTVDGLLVGSTSLVGKNLNCGNSTVVLNPLQEKAAYVGAVGHFTWWAPHTPTSVDTAVLARGWAGETAADRKTRLCAELGILFQLVDPWGAADTALLGPQPMDTPLNILAAAAEADQGILFESRSDYGLVYATRNALYNQAVRAALDYSAGQVFEPFRPTEDDQTVLNDVIARMSDGSWARVIVDDGPLSNQDPPSGVGTYDEDRTYNVYAADQLPHVASWRAHLGTWDEARFPQVHVDLAAPAYAASGLLTGKALTLDVGSYFTVANPPAWLPPDLIELMVQGCREVHNVYGLDLTWNCVPYGPYRVGVFDNTTNRRYDSRSTTVAEALDTTETGVDIAVTAGRPGWVTGSSSPVFPFYVIYGGEVMRVDSNASTGTGTYTMTVARSINGVVKSHSSGGELHVYQPGVYAY